MTPAERAVAFNLAILQCTELEGIKTAFENAISQFGFTWFACGDMELETRKRTVIYVTNWPEEWRKYYLKGEVIEQDPMIAQLATRHQPFWWTLLPGKYHIDPVSDDLLRNWLGMGLRSGLCVPLPGAGRNLGLVSLVGPQDDFADEVFAAAVAMAVCLYEHSHRLASRLGVNIQFAGLSPRELDCLRLIGKGWSDKKIAHLLVIAPSTVHDYVESLKAKLNVRSRTEAVAIAVSLGLAEG